MFASRDVDAGRIPFLLILMAWLPVTLSDLEGWIQPDRLRTAFAARGPGEQGGAFNVIAAGVVARIRSKVAQHHDLDSDSSTVPPELHELACLTVASHVLARLGMTSTDAAGGVFTLTNEQRTRLKALEADLELVAKGELGVSLPDGNSDGSEPYDHNAVQLASTPVRRVLGRSATEGL